MFPAKRWEIRPLRHLIDRGDGHGGDGVSSSGFVMWSMIHRGKLVLDGKHQVTIVGDRLGGYYGVDRANIMDHGSLLNMEPNWESRQGGVPEDSAPVGGGVLVQI